MLPEAIPSLGYNTVPSESPGLMSSGGSALLTTERSLVTLSPKSPPFSRYLNPASFLRHLWSERDLIGQFTRREVEGRYRSSLLGIAWSFITPLVLLLVYTFVFGVVLKQRWPGLGSDGLAQFGLVLFAGLIAFGIFSECVNRAPGLIVGTPNYVKRVVFPLEFLPVSVLGSALFHAAISLTVLLAAHLALGGPPHWTWLLIPLVLLPIVFISLGLLWAFSSLGVFIRDLTYTVTLVVQVLFFVTPIVYPIEAIPLSLRSVIQYNPLASVIETLRAVIFAGVLTGWRSLLVSSAVGLVVMIVGYAWFMKTRRAFGDVI
jgi:lipopolysaccharide transport system permease protein